MTPSESENYLTLLSQINERAQLVVVSKKRSIDEINALYRVGCRDFGENRVQELLMKAPLLPGDIRWHFIGPLQKNKVHKILSLVDLIHSVDSISLAKEISKRSLEFGLEIKILLQVNTSGEISKQGFSKNELGDIWTEISSLPGISVRGLMTMAPLTEDSMMIRNCFGCLRDLSNELFLQELSMGMSNDWKIALEEGSSILRIGSHIFQGCHLDRGM